MSQRTADAILNETFLDARCRLLEVAAMFDRIDRAGIDTVPLSESTQKRYDQLHAALQILASSNPDRAEQLQRLFSREYLPDWRENMNV
jgi:hypothetical protein